MKRVLNPTKDVSTRTRDSKGVFVKMFGERTKVCTTCNRVFTPTRKNYLRAKFCSVACRGRDKRGKVGLRKGTKQSEATRLKISKANSGEKAHQWVKDRGLLKDESRERGGQLHREWSNSVKKRDSWKCRIENEDCNGMVVAHHILSWRDFVELRYEINNGITLCKRHHPLKRKDEREMVSVFQEIVSLTPSYHISDSRYK